MRITEAEDALFSQWKELCSEMVCDGVVNEAVYLSSTPRIALVLKDVNSPDSGGWDLRDVLRREIRPYTWDNVTRWVRGIRRGHATLRWADVQPVSHQDRLDEVASLCVINLKKDVGAGTSDRNAVRGWAHKHRDLLQAQYGLYQPDLVICGGVGELFRELFCPDLSWSTTSRGVKYLDFNGAKVISYYHPQARFPHDMLYYTLVDGVHEIMG